MDSLPTTMVREGDVLVASDGRKAPIGEAKHVAPCKPTKIVSST
jgi:hypothetical protein